MRNCLLMTVTGDSAVRHPARLKEWSLSVLIDVNVGLPRCGIDSADAGRLADRARNAGLEVRGVMGYEGHLMMVRDPKEKADRVSASMEMLLQASADVGGDIVSGGGTGTCLTNTWCTEIQAGSYTLMDTDYCKLGLPFELALNVVATVISVNMRGWITADAGIKSMAMDHGNPRWEHGDVFFLSDEHITLSPNNINDWEVGDRVRLQPAHVDPTIAKHQQMWLVDGDSVVDRWAVDLRHW